MEQTRDFSVEKGNHSMPQVIKSIEAVRNVVRDRKRENQVVGFVPTMGALHTGHVRLIEEARKASGLVVVSIFVNPTQFGPSEDYTRYPRTFETDLEQCEKAGADVVFFPDVAEIYPQDRPSMTFVEVPRLSEIFEGAIRPGHFRGVATVVCKLFNIVLPDVAYFGAKDFQQQLIIRRAVQDLNFPVEIRTIDTVREPDGLALSSRNRYLDTAQRKASGMLWQALSAARVAVREGERDANRVRQILTRAIESEQRASLDYAEVADVETLESLRVLPSDGRAVALLAVRFGTTRLIDNTLLTDGPGCV